MKVGSLCRPMWTLEGQDGAGLRPLCGNALMLGQCSSLQRVMCCARVHAAIHLLSVVSWVTSSLGAEVKPLDN